MAFFLVQAVMQAGIMSANCSAVNVGGDYGRSWLNENKNATQSSNVTKNDSDLWSWGSVPKGQMLVDGKLEVIGDRMYFAPAFALDMIGVSPVKFNSTLNKTSPQDMLSPFIISDPWFDAQSRGRPVSIDV
jgi:hypothetical protein